MPRPSRKYARKRPFDQVLGVAACLRPRDQAVRVPRVRLSLDPLECEIDADGAARGADALVDFRGALRAAELRFEIGAPVDAVARQIGIQLERMPAHDGVNVGLARGVQRERLAEAAATDEAPRAHDVGNDVDGHCARGVCRIHRSPLCPLPRDGA